MSSAAANTLTITTPSDTEIVLTRQFNAPRELVFRVITDPALVSRWWGPRNTNTRVDRMEVRQGGAWRFVCREDNGTEYAFRGEYLEIDPPHRIVQTFEFEPMAGHVSTETMTLEEKDGRTIMTARSVFASKEDRDGMIASGMEQGASETYDRLEELLETMS